MMFVYVQVYMEKYEGFLRMAFLNAPGSIICLTGKQAVYKL